MSINLRAFEQLNQPVSEWDTRVFKIKKHLFVLSCVERDFNKNHSGFNKLQNNSIHFLIFLQSKNQISGKRVWFNHYTIVILLKISQQEHFKKEIHK